MEETIATAEVMKHHREKHGHPEPAPEPKPISQEEIETGLRAEIEDLKGKYQRSLADFANYQRRAIENERDARRQGTVSAISSLLGVLDNFDLALRHDAASGGAESMARGVSMIRDQMAQALSSLGVKPITPEPGDEFEPRRHEAVVQIESPGVKPGRIASLLQTGYEMGDWILRPAKVGIAKGREEGSAAAEPPPT